MDKRFIPYLLILLWLVMGCGVEPLPENQEGTPEFFAKGTLEQTSFDWVAGEEMRYMNTDYRYEEQGLYTLIGSLGEKECLDCPGNLTVKIRDFRLREQNSRLDIDSALERTIYAYYREDGAEGPQVTRVAFENESTGGNYQWNFGDGTTHTGANPVHEYQDSALLSPQVCLETVDGSGCVTAICNEVLLEETDCAVDFEHSLYPNSTYVEFRAEVRGQQPFRYRWDFGDGYGASLGNPGYSYAEAGLYRVCLTVTDGNGCQRTICKNIAADPEQCEHNFSYEVTRTAVIDTLQFSRVEVEWFDEDGTRFSSALGNQLSSSHFQLLSHEAYQANEERQQTEKLTLDLTCTLFSEDGREKTLVLDDAVLGVAFP